MKILGLIAAWLKLRGPDIPYAALESKYAGRTSRFVDLPRGLHVHYEDEGNASLPLLMLLLVEPAGARKFAAGIPGAKLILYPHVGHLPQIEIPLHSAADVARFLQAHH